MNKLVILILTIFSFTAIYAADKNSTVPKKGVLQSTKDGARRVKNDVKTSTKSAWKKTKRNTRGAKQKTKRAFKKSWKETKYGAKDAWRKTKNAFK